MYPRASKKNRQLLERKKLIFKKIFSITSLILNSKFIYFKNTTTLILGHLAFIKKKNSENGRVTFHALVTDL